YQFTAKPIYAGQVASRPCQTGDQPDLDRVFATDKHDGNRRGGGLDGERGGTSCRDHGNLATNQFGRQFRQPLGSIIGPAIIDSHVLAFDKARLLQALMECAQLIADRMNRCGVEEPHNWHRLLRADHEWPRDRRTAEQGDERAAFHSITSSARASNDGGSSIPRAFAVFVLITSSNFTGA